MHILCTYITLNIHTYQHTSSPKISATFSNLHKTDQSVQELRRKWRNC